MSMYRLVWILWTTLLPRVSIIYALALSTPTKPKNLLILGFGRVGSEVASLLRENQHQRDNIHPIFDKIIGTLQSEEDSVLKNCNDIAAYDIQKIPFCSDALQTVLPHCSHVLVTIPPPIKRNPRSKINDNDNENNDLLEQVYDIVVRWLPKKSWIGIISTTGVYGHQDGKWVDEDAPLLCQEGTSASAFRDMEHRWQQRVATMTTEGKSNSNSRHKLYIFRCAGIYGPESSALHTLYKRGRSEPAIKTTSSISLVLGNKNQTNSAAIPSNTTTTKSGLTNRIHIKDISRAVVAAMVRQPNANGTYTTHENDLNNKTQRSCFVYNLADDRPEARDVVMKYAAHLFEAANITIPAESESNNSASTPSSSRRARRRSAELKLVNNARMKKELMSDEGFLYPSYVEGLRAILALPDMPWMDRATNKNPRHQD